MDPIIGSALISAGAGVVQQGGNFLSDLVFNKQRKELQQQIFQREDTAVQRRAADLEAAGLSKTLAAGGGAQAGSVVSMNAPKMEGENPVQAYISGREKGLAAEAAREQNNLFRQQVRKATADADSQEIENNILRETMGGTIAEKNADARYAVETLSDRIDQMSQETTAKALRNAESNLDLTIKNLNIEKSTMDNATAKVKTEFISEYGMDEMRAELAAKVLAVEISRYNKDWYERIELPTTGGGSLITQIIGSLMQSRDKNGGSMSDKIKSWLKTLDPEKKWHW